MTKKKGRFTGPLDMRNLANGRHWMLLKPLTYEARDSQPIAVPVGFITDLASIPRFFWRFLPPIGKYDYAAVLHDYLYRNDSVPLVEQEEADRVMLHAMEDSPQPPNWLTRRLVYLGVCAGGSHAFHQHGVEWKPRGLEYVTV